MARPAKRERYRRIREQLEPLLRETEEPVARRATVVALLHHKLPDVSWTGFYLLRDGRLVVDVYQGPLACIELLAHTGVCWAGIDRGESVIVPDVSTFPGHIACDGSARSGIVVPLRDRSGETIGVLDLDSRVPGRFDGEDREGLEAIVSLLP